MDLSRLLRQDFAMTNKKPKHRQRVIEAAREMMAEQQFSIRPLVRRARVAASTAYKLFDSKQRIIAAILEEEHASFEQRLETLHPGDSIDRIFGIVELAIAGYAEQPGFYRSLLMATYRSADDVLNATSEGPRLGGWIALLEEGMAEGLIRSDLDPEIIGKTAIRVILGSALEWVQKEAPIERVRAEVGYGVALVIGAIATDASRARIDEQATRYRQMILDLVN
jgi:AcrR family transcriptional regulator